MVFQTTAKGSYMEENTELLRKLAFRLKALREERGWTQETFADHIGMDRSSYAGTECGLHNPKLSTLKKYADGFGMSLSEFFSAF